VLRLNATVPEVTQEPAPALVPSSGMR